GPYLVARGIGRRRDVAPDPGRARTCGGLRPSRAGDRRGRGPRAALSPRRPGPASGVTGMMTSKQSNIGIAVVGAGRIGTLRARLAAKHPAVRFLAISDRDPARARAVSEQAGADLYSGDNNE